MPTLAAVAATGGVRLAADRRARDSTDSAGLNSRSRRRPRISGRISRDRRDRRPALMAKVTTMPASMAERPSGEFLSDQPVSGPNRPVATSRSRVTMKARRASADAEAAGRGEDAAPGVDQALMTGIFVRRRTEALDRQLADASVSAATAIGDAARPRWRLAPAIAPTASAAAMMQSPACRRSRRWPPRRPKRRMESRMSTAARESAAEVVARLSFAAAMISAQRHAEADDSAPRRPRRDWEPGARSAPTGRSRPRPRGPAGRDPAGATGDGRRPE